MSKRRRSRTPIIHEGHIDRLSHDGRGICQREGKTIFVSHALPGETVRYQVMRQRATYEDAQMIEVLTRSPDRVTPRCPHTEQCGGCQLQHMPMAQQIALKEDAFFAQLTHQAGCQPQRRLPPLDHQHWGYRVKARLSVRYVPGKSQVLVGFRERQSHYVTHCQTCPILHPALGQRIDALSQCLSQLEDKTGIPQIEVALGLQHALILRHLRPLSTPDATLLITFAKQHGFRLYLQPSGPDSVSLFYPTDTTDNTTEPTDPTDLTQIPTTAEPVASPVKSTLSYYLPQWDLTLYFYPQQFIQVNPGMNQRMLAQAMTLMECSPEDCVLDLFCGIGNFSLPLARHCQHVIGLELDPSAIAMARYNAQQNSCTNTTFDVADLTQPQSIGSDLWRTCNKVLLDPPRTGADAILQALLNTPNWRPERLVYVSCHPATLARDAKYLIEAGYTLAAAGVMNMFPHTQHVEAMACFVDLKKNATSNIGLLRRAMPSSQ